MRVLVTGGRTYSDYGAVRAALEPLRDPSLVIVRGGASGADKLATRYAGEHGASVEVWPADWARYGKRAGPIRNAAMVATMPDLVLAFPGGRGTEDCVRRALATGLDVRRVG